MKVSLLTLVITSVSARYGLRYRRYRFNYLHKRVHCFSQFTFTLYDLGLVSLYYNIPAHIKCYCHKNIKGKTRSVSKVKCKTSKMILWAKTRRELRIIRFGKMLCVSVSHSLEFFHYFRPYNYGPMLGTTYGSGTPCTSPLGRTSDLQLLSIMDC